MNSFQKILIGINGLLIVALVALMILFSKSQSSASVETSDTLNVVTPALPKAQGKIMFINIDTFQSKYKFFKQIQKELDNVGMRNQNELKVLENKFVNTYNKYQKEASVMSEFDMRNAQEDLAKQEKIMQEREETLTTAYAKLAQDKNNQYLDKVKEYLKRKSGEHNYAYVLGYVRESNLLYAQDTLDITNLVVEGMNAEYDATQK